MINYIFNDTIITILDFLRHMPHSFIVYNLIGYLRHDYIIFVMEVLKQY